MSTPNDTRPIWLTREQRDALRGGPSAWIPVLEITAAWDAAPADAVEVVAQRMAGFAPLSHENRVHQARAVLVALGYPGGRAAPPPTTTTTTP